MQISLAVPPILTVMGWVLLMAPRTGFINVALRQLQGQPGLGAGASGPLNVYSSLALFVVTGLGVAPGMYLMLGAAFQNMDSRLEEAGQTSGGSNMATVRRVTLPLMFQSLAAAAMYYVMLLFETFEMPLVIGPNANFRVLSIYVFDLVRPQSMAPQYGQAAAFGTLMIVASLMLAAGYGRVTRKVFKFAIVRGQRQGSRLMRLGAWRFPVLGGVGLYSFSAKVCRCLASSGTASSPLLPSHRPIRSSRSR